MICNPTTEDRGGVSSPDVTLVRDEVTAAKMLNQNAHHENFIITERRQVHQVVTKKITDSLRQRDSLRKESLCNFVIF